MLSESPLPTRSMKNARSDFRRIVLENCSSSVEGRARDYHFRTQHTSDLAPCLAGCRGFIGPIPQPLSMKYSLVAFAESYSTMFVRFVNQFLKILCKYLTMSGFMLQYCSQIECHRGLAAAAAAVERCRMRPVKQ